VFIRLNDCGFTLIANGAAVILLANW